MGNRVKVFAFLSCPRPKQSLADLLLSAIPGYNNRIIRKRFFSLNREEVEGCLIKCPRPGLDFETVDQAVLLNSLLKADELARKLGALILGVEGYADRFSERWDKVCQKIKIPLTTGRSLLAWTVFEAIYRTARLKRMDLKNVTVGIIGAATSTGALCGKKLSGYVRRIVLYDLYPDRLSKLRQAIPAFGPAELALADTLEDAIKGVDVLVIDPWFHNNSLPLENLNSGGIICNIFLPQSEQPPAKPLKGQTMVNAGLIKLPEPNNLKICVRVQKNIVCASIAETMLLTLENNFSDFSGSADTNLDNLEEIADMATRHGFEVWVPEAPLL